MTSSKKLNTNKKGLVWATLSAGALMTSAGAGTTVSADEKEDLAKLTQEEVSIESDIKTMENSLEVYKASIHSNNIKAKTSANMLALTSGKKNLVKDILTSSEDLEKKKQTYKNNKVELETLRARLAELKNEQSSLETTIKINEAKAEEAKKIAEEKAKAEEAKKAAEEKKQASTQQTVSKSTSATTTSGSLSTGSANYTISNTANSYPAGQCTWGVKSVAPWVGDYWGNAGQWVSSAQAAGFETGTQPRPGAVAVWPSDGGGYGHVAYVTDVQSATNIQVVESNYNGNMYISNFRGWFNPQATWSGSAVYYIYPKG